MYHLLQIAALTDCQFFLHEQCIIKIVAWLTEGQTLLIRIVQFNPKLLARKKLHLKCTKLNAKIQIVEAYTY